MASFCFVGAAVPAKVNASFAVFEPLVRQKSVKNVSRISSSFFTAGSQSRLSLSKRKLEFAKDDASAMVFASLKLSPDTPKAQDQLLQVLAARAQAGVRNAALALAFAAAANFSFATNVEALVPGPPRDHVVDDAAVLNRSTIGDINRTLGILQDEQGINIDIVVIRALDGIEESPAEYADALYKKWFADTPDASKSGVVVIVTKIARGALTAGDGVLAKLPEGIKTSIIEETIHIPAGDNRYNAASYDAAKRISLVLSGKADPGPPKVKLGSGESTFASKEETEANKGTNTTALVVLVVVSSVATQALYYYYVGLPKWLGGSRDGI